MEIKLFTKYELLEAITWMDGWAGR